jgi:hypothetical protein
MACKDGFFCGEYLPFGPKKKTTKYQMDFLGLGAERAQNLHISRKKVALAIIRT